MGGTAAEGAQVGVAGQVVAGHQVHGPGREEPDAVEFAAAAQQLHEAVVVVGGGHHAAAARQEPRPAAQGQPRDRRDAAALLLAVHLRQPGRLLVRDVEARVRHAEGAEDPLGTEHVERLPRHDLDDPAQDVAGHRVVPLGARLELQRQTRVHLDGLGQVGARRHRRLQAGRAVQGVDGVGVVEAEGQTRGVGHQMPDEYGAVGRAGP